MATEFTLFPKLIPELRLEIWQLALPAPLKRLLYPYDKGCWVLEDLGLQPDPNGEDLQLRFEPTLLQPLRIELPLYSVNHEARGVTIKYLQKQGLVAARGSAHSDFEFLRHFDTETDTVFLPTARVEEFVTEPIDRMHEPDLVDRFLGSSRPALPRLAITSAGLESVKGDALATLFDFGGTIDILYVVDGADGGGHAFSELEDCSTWPLFEVCDAPLSRLLWNKSMREWEVFGDGEASSKMRKLVEGLDDPAHSTSDYDIEVQLVHLADVGIRVIRRR